MDISVVNKLKKYSELNVMLISDEFTANNMKDEFNIFRPTPENFREILDNNDIDLFFCESAMQGNNNSWALKIRFNENPILKLLVKECKERNIPTIFWSKEDPVHFRRFIDSAKVFDYVFTGDTDMITEYKKYGCKNVFFAPIFFNPKMFNPIKEMERQNKISFAGTYYSNLYQLRVEFMNNMLDVFGDYGLEIYDRNFHDLNTPYKFPEKFNKYIVGYLPAEDVKKSYKGYKVCINTNTVTESNTMFARRIIESMACNTPVISSYAKSVNLLFNGLIVASNDKEVLREQAEILFNDDKEYQYRQLQGVREAFGKYTTKKVVLDILKKSEIDFEYNDIKKVNVIAICKTKQDVDKAIFDFKKQTFSDKMLYILNESSLNFERYESEDAKVLSIKNISEVKSLLDVFKYNYTTIFHNDINYDQYHIEDMMNTYNYLSEDTVVTRNVGEEYSFTTKFNPKYAVFSKQAFKELNFESFVFSDIVDVEKQAFNINNNVDYIKFENKFFRADNPSINLEILENGKLRISCEDNEGFTERLYYTYKGNGDSLDDECFCLKANSKYRVIFDFEKLSEVGDPKIAAFIYNNDLSKYETKLLSGNLEDDLIYTDEDVYIKLLISVRDNIECIVNKLILQEVK